MNSHSIALHDFDISFVKDFSKIIRLANYDFPLNRNSLSALPAAMQPRLHFTVNRLAVSPSTISPACSFTLNPLTASPPTVNHIYCFSLDSNACCLTCNLESRLLLRPLPLAPLAVSPSTISPACSFALNPLAPSRSTRLQLYM